MQRLTSPMSPGRAGCAGLVKLGLTLLAGLTICVGRAQDSFSSAQNLGMAVYGTVTNNNSVAVVDIGAPNIAGFVPQHPLWYVWTAPQDGDVDVDTLGSVGAGLIGVTNIDTVLGVYQGNGSSPKYLNQLAANDDLYPINSTFGNAHGGLVSAAVDFAVGKMSLPSTVGYIPSYYGPSHLRFTAKAGQTYYFAEDAKGQIGNLRLSWAYESSGVFRFATEDQDWLTGLPLYQTAKTESLAPQGNGDVDVDTVVGTYYIYNAPGGAGDGDAQCRLNRARHCGLQNDTNHQYCRNFAKRRTRLLQQGLYAGQWPIGV